MVRYFKVVEIPRDDFVRVNGSYDKMNGSYDKMNGSYDKMNGSYDKMNDGYLYLYNVYKQVEKLAYEYSREYSSKQWDILQEECAELISAISHLRRGRCSGCSEVVEEITHVLISAITCVMCYNIPAIDILNEVNRKVGDHNDHA